MMTRRIFFAFLFVLLAMSVSARQQDGRVTDTAAGLDLEFSEMKHDLGTLSENGPSAGHTFTVTNRGTAPVAILSATASCGCTHPEFSKKPLAPGESSDIKVRFVPAGQKGEFSKDIRLRFKSGSGKSKRVTLRITGVVVP